MAATPILSSSSSASYNVSPWPPGFRFRPRDSEIIGHYLIKRIRCEELPANLINDVDVYLHNPDQLTLDITNDKESWAYFFSFRTQKYDNGSQCNRSTPDGYWKPSGVEKHIKVHKKIAAFKRKFVFYKGNSVNSVKTPWIMQEYRLNPELVCLKNLPDPKMKDCVICKVYTRKRIAVKSKQSKNSRSVTRSQ